MMTCNNSSCSMVEQLMKIKIELAKISGLLTMAQSNVDNTREMIDLIDKESDNDES